MTELPLYLFLLPQKESFERKTLENFLDYRSSEISIFLPWLSSEILVNSGSFSLLNIIEKEGSKRISVSKLHKYIYLNDKINRIIDQNNNYNENIDIQSISGFVECLRKYCVDSLIKNNISSNEIVSYTGISIRTIQRMKTINTSLR